MRHWIHRSIGVGLVACAWGCASDTSHGGSGGHGGAATEATGGPSSGAADGGSGQLGAGCKLAASGIQISRAEGTTPAIVWTGRGYVVAWRDLSADEGDIRVALLDEGGDKQREELVEGGPATSSHPSIARAEDGLLVVWQDAHGAGSLVRGRRVSLDGVPAGTAFEIAPSSAPEAWPIVASSAGATMATWMDGDRSVLGFLGEQGLRSAIPIQHAKFPALAANGDRSTLSWSTEDTIGFAPVRPDTTSLDGRSHDVARPQLTRGALGGADTFIAWEDDRTGTEQIRVIGVSEQDGVSGEVVVSGESDGSANWPALAWTGRHLAVAYYQFRDRPPGVYVTLIGAGVEPLGVDVKLSGSAPARFPAVAWSGKELAVVYAENDRGIRLSRATCP